MGRKKRKTLVHGIASTVDMFGMGFDPQNDQNNITTAWHNVGVYFSRGLQSTSRELSDGRVTQSEDDLICY